MKKLLSAVASASILLSTGVAMAQGLPPGYNRPAYGSVWASQQRAQNELAAANRNKQAHSDQVDPRVAEQGSSVTRHGIRPES